MALKRIDGLVAPASEWQVGGSVRTGGIATVEGAGAAFLLSPQLCLEPGILTAFVVDVEFEGEGEGEFVYGFQSPVDASWLAGRNYRGMGRQRFAITSNPRSETVCMLSLHIRTSNGKPVTIRSIEVTALRPEHSPAPEATEANTVLAHWGPIRRWIHARCKRSARFNGLVAGLEMRLGREELLSLPQYMSLCPTGQCNALCDFCSVTINRTGIVKRQLSQELLERFLAPVAGTIRMYGLEGNGEPTLHPRFESLVERLTTGDTQAYLITNASRLWPERLPLLLALESVNVSFNAATAETHRKVMKLKDFEAVRSSITELARIRGVPTETWKPTPRLSVSFVATADNVHEAQDFLRLAEDELKVDMALVRPLSELGNDLGAVEDLRNIVPYESDVRDMLDGIEDYVADRCSHLEVRTAPETFRSVRPDPVGGVLMPRGYEGRLLAPRRRSWTALSEQLEVRWDLNRVELSVEDGALGPIWQSHLIPVEPGKTLHFSCTLTVEGGPVTISVLDECGTEMVREVVSDTAGESRRLDLDFETGSREEVRLSISAGGRALRAMIDFERLRTPASYMHGDFRLPRPARWEKGVEGVELTWESGSALRLRWSGAAGPYLAKSYTIPCAKGRRMVVPVTVRVASGRLGVGVLDETFSNWIMTAEFEQGEKVGALTFDVGTNERVQIVLYSATQAPLDARVDWHELRSPAGGHQPVRAVAKVAAEAVFAEAAAASQPSPFGAIVAGTPDAQPVRAMPTHPEATAASRMPEPQVGRESVLSRLGQVFGRLLHGRDRIYCHKPWTDLHNFTVDGRMDVCCIATGPSQERYAWGNLKTQNFQEVWNGATAKEFRRTVNSSRPLPPCARCPMTHAYQGMWFDPEASLHGLRLRLWNSRIAKLPGGSRLMFLVYAPLALVMNGLVFRGFRRRPLFGKGK